MNKISVTIGIPAYNEEANIKKIIEQVLAQKAENFMLEKVIVISDGSSDKTEEEVRKISDIRVELIAHHNRKGKAVRFQELLGRVESDVFVQFDGDTKIDDTFTLEKLVQAVSSGADLVFPKVMAQSPRTYIEKLSDFGFSAWELVISQIDQADALIYRCQGRCRAFSKIFYKSFILPVEADGVEDLYSFCFATVGGYKIKYVPEARVIFRLPSSGKDFLKQSRRFIKGTDSLSRFYDLKLVVNNSPGAGMKIKAFLKNCVRYLPHISIGYVVMQLYAHKTATMHDQKPMYEYVGSTKELS